MEARLAAQGAKRRNLADEGEVGRTGLYAVFERIEGDHFTIRGLPFLALLDYLRVRGHLPL